MLLNGSELDKLANVEGDLEQVFLGYPYGAKHAPWWTNCRAELEAKYEFKFTVPSGEEAIGGLFKKIAERIAKSGLCVFDLTGSNPNVCIELGFAAALGKPIKIARASDDSAPVPADVQGQDRIEFSSEQDLTDKLKRFLSQYYKPSDYRLKEARWTEQLIANRLSLLLGRRGPAESCEDRAEDLAKGIGCDEAKLVRNVLENSSKFERNPKTGCWSWRD